MMYLKRNMIVNILNDPHVTVDFDSHTAEMRALRLYAEATAKEILRYVGTPDPLRQFSSAFAKYINRTFAGQLLKHGPKIVTSNLGGKPSPNTKWTKLHPPIY